MALTPDEEEVFHQIVRTVTGVPQGQIEQALARVRAILAAADSKLEEDSPREQKTGRDRLERSGRTRLR